MVSDADIAAALEKQSPQWNPARLGSDLALLAGGKDNATVVLASYQIPTVGQ